MRFVQIFIPPTEQEAAQLREDIGFAPEEAVWAVDLGGGNYRLENDPLREGLEVGDVVQAVHGDDGRLRFAGHNLVTSAAEVTH